MKRVSTLFFIILFMLGSGIDVTPVFAGAPEKERVAYAIDQTILAHNITTHIFSKKDLLERDLCLAVGQPKDLDYLLLKAALQPYEVPLLLSLYRNIMHKYDMHVCSDFESLYYQRLVYFIDSLPTMSSDEKQKLSVTLQTLKDDPFLVIPLVKFSIRFMSIISHQTLSVPLKKQNVDMILSDFNEECRSALPTHKGSDTVQLNAHINHFNTSFKQRIFDTKPVQYEVWWKRWYRAITSQRSLLGLNMMGVFTTAAVSIVIVHVIRRFISKGQALTTKAEDLMTTAQDTLKQVKDEGITTAVRTLINTLLDDPEKLKVLYQKVFDVDSCIVFIEGMRQVNKKYNKQDLSPEEIKKLASTYYSCVPQEVTEKILTRMIDEVMGLIKKDKNNAEAVAFKQFCFDMTKTVVGTLADKGVVTDEILQVMEGLSKKDGLPERGMKVLLKWVAEMLRKQQTELRKQQTAQGQNKDKS